MQNLNLTNKIDDHDLVLEVPEASDAEQLDTIKNQFISELNLVTLQLCDIESISKRYKDEIENFKAENPQLANSALEFIEQTKIAYLNNH